HGSVVSAPPVEERTCRRLPPQAGLALCSGCMLARCPNCRNTFSTDRSGRQECPACGKPLVVPEQAAAPSAPGEVGPGEGTPWERRAELGTLRAWSQTMQMALLEPGKLFA